MNDHRTSGEPGQPAPVEEASPVNPGLLLDTLAATEPEWATLPSQLPLFLLEAGEGLAEVLEVAK